MHSLRIGAFCQHFCIAEFAFFVRKIAAGQTNYGFWVLEPYEELEPEKVEALFHGDNTHTSVAGAELNAESVIAGLKALKSNPLARYFSDRSKRVSKWKVDSKINPPPDRN